MLAYWVFLLGKNWCCIKAIHTQKNLLYNSYPNRKICGILTHSLPLWRQMTSFAMWFLNVCRMLYDLWLQFPLVMHSRREQRFQMNTARQEIFSEKLFLGAVFINSTNALAGKGLKPYIIMIIMYSMSNWYMCNFLFSKHLCNFHGRWRAWSLLLVALSWWVIGVWPITWAIASGI